MFVAVAMILTACGGDDSAEATDPPAATATSTDEATSTGEAGAAQAAVDAADDSQTETPTISGDVVADAISAGCPAFPSYSEGPYFLDDAPERSDLAENVDGAPLEVRIVLLDAATCEPLADQAVDLWSADPHGRYSGVADPFDPDAATDADLEARWLRGNQVTDVDGVVEFETVVPGWTPGDPPHLSLTTPIDEQQSFTWRLVLDDDATAQVYSSGAYAERGANPRGADVAEPGSVVVVSQDGDRYSIDVAVAVDMSQLRQRPVSAGLPSQDDVGSAPPITFAPELEDLPGEIQSMFATAASDLGVDADELYEQFRYVGDGSPPDLPAIAEALGVTVEDLAEALPLLAGGAPTG